MKKRNLIIVLVIIGLLAAGAVAWLFVTGKISLQGQAASNTSAVVCDSDKVMAYNDAREFKVRGTSTEATADTQGLQALATSIKETAGNENDATCQTILLWSAYFADNYNEAKAAYENIKRLHEARVFADTNLLGILPVASYQAMVSGLSPDNENPTGMNGD